MEINGHCTHCGQPVTVDSRYLGQQVTCPKCANPFLVSIASGILTPAPIAPLVSTTPYMRKSSAAAITSLVLGILSFFCLGPIGSILAIIFGLVARSQIKAAPTLFNGGGMATAGIILGIIGILLTVAMLVFWLFFADSR